MILFNDLCPGIQGSLFKAFSHRPLNAIIPCLATKARNCLIEMSPAKQVIEQVQNADCQAVHHAQTEQAVCDAMEHNKSGWNHERKITQGK